MFSTVLWLLRAIIFSIMTFKWSTQSATAKATIVFSISLGRPYPKFIPLNNNSWGNIKSCLIERGSDCLGALVCTWVHFGSLEQSANLKSRRPHVQRVRVRWSFSWRVGQVPNCHPGAQWEVNCHLLTIKRSPRREKAGGKESGVYELLSKQTQTEHPHRRVTRHQGQVFLSFFLATHW